MSDHDDLLAAMTEDTTPRPINWADYGVEDTENMPTDWQPVVSLVRGGYDWLEFHAFYSPSARRYFWMGGSGCSCNSWGSEVTSGAAFQDGRKVDLGRALRRFADDHSHHFVPTDLVDALDKLSRHRPSRGKGE